MWQFICSALAYIAVVKITNPYIVCIEEVPQIIEELPSNAKIVNFAAGAGNWPYYYGIARFIQDTYKLENISFLGTSAGSGPISGLLHNIPIHVMFEETNTMISNLKRCWFGILSHRLLIDYQILGKTFFDKPEYKNLDLSKHNRLFVGVSTPLFKKKYFTNFANTKSMIDSFIISTWIPFIIAPTFQPFCKYGDGFYLDGFMSGKDKHKNMLVIKPNMWKTYSKYTNAINHWIWLDPKHNRKMYYKGYLDAENNRQTFDDFFG
jgi:hypothetical protein